MRMQHRGLYGPYLLQDAGVRADLRAEGCEHADHGAAAVDDLRGQARERHGLCTGRIKIGKQSIFTPHHSHCVCALCNIALQLRFVTHVGNVWRLQACEQAVRAWNLKLGRMSTCERANIVVGGRPGGLVERLCVDAASLLRMVRSL